MTSAGKLSRPLCRTLSQLHFGVALVTLLDPLVSIGNLTGSSGGEYDYVIRVWTLNLRRARPCAFPNESAGRRRDYFSSTEMKMREPVHSNPVLQLLHGNLSLDIHVRDGPLAHSFSLCLSLSRARAETHLA